jgi:hypothetical protein
MLKRIIAAVAGALLAASAGQAQALEPQQDEASTEIVVEGARNFGRQVSIFVNALADAPVKRQLSRFEWSVCPTALGLADLQNVAVARRLRRVAEAAGIKVEPHGCTPNVLVLVTDDKRQLIQEMYKQRPSYFKGVGRDTIKRLANGPERAAAWHVEGRVDRDGILLSLNPLTGSYTVEMTEASSRLVTASRPIFAVAVVVVQIDALEGLTVTQLADYAAMRAFARTDPERLDSTSAGSILRILDAPMGSPVPITLTEWDLAYLKGLYASDPNRFAFQQRNEIKHLMGKELTRP